MKAKGPGSWRHHPWLLLQLACAFSATPDPTWSWPEPPGCPLAGWRALQECAGQERVVAFPHTCLSASAITWPSGKESRSQREPLGAHPSTSGVRVPLHPHSPTRTQAPSQQPSSILLKYVPFPWNCKARTVKMKEKVKQILTAEAMVWGDRCSLIQQDKCCYHVNLGHRSQALMTALRLETRKMFLSAPSPVNPTDSFICSCFLLSIYWAPTVCWVGHHHGPLSDSKARDSDSGAGLCPIHDESPVLTSRGFYTYCHGLPRKISTLLSAFGALPWHCFIL